MKLEVGKFYRTRDGQKVECVAVWSKPELNEFQVTCLFIGGTFTRHARNWRLTGEYNQRGFISDLDIVAEWREPTLVAGWVNVYSPGHPEDTGWSEIFPSRALADDLATKDRIACVCVSGVEKVRDGA